MNSLKAKDAFDDDIYVEDSGDNGQETDIAYVDICQPGVAPYRHEPAVKRVRHWRRPGCSQIDSVVLVIQCTSPQIVDVLTLSCLLKFIFRCMYPSKSSCVCEMCNRNDVIRRSIGLV